MVKTILTRIRAWILARSRLWHFVKFLLIRSLARIGRQIWQICPYRILSIFFRKKLGNIRNLDKMLPVQSWYHPSDRITQGIRSPNSDPFFFCLLKLYIPFVFRVLWPIRPSGRERRIWEQKIAGRKMHFSLRKLWRDILPTDTDKMPFIYFYGANDTD